jgi:hypothetical protein
MSDIKDYRPKTKISKDLIYKDIVPKDMVYKDKDLKDMISKDKDLKDNPHVFLMLAGVTLDQSGFRVRQTPAESAGVCRSPTESAGVRRSLQESDGVCQTMWGSVQSSCPSSFHR